MWCWPPSAGKQNEAGSVLVHLWRANRQAEGGRRYTEAHCFVRFGYNELATASRRSAISSVEACGTVAVSKRTRTGSKMPR